MKPNPTALIIDDDRANRRLLRMLLGANRYRLLESESGHLGLAAAREAHPDVIILELALPDMPGVTLLKQLRKSNRTPVLVLSFCPGETETVAALDAGANDYMAKPFSNAELLARLRVLQRCVPSEFDEPVLVEGDLKTDLTRHITTLDGRHLDLTPTEEALFHALVKYAGKVVTGKWLRRSVWGAEWAGQGECLRVFMSSLRKKLEDAQGRVVIETAGTLGYRLLLRSGSPFASVLSFG